MRKFYHSVASVFILFFFLIGAGKSWSQDFSNKGKDFWVAYGYHQVMTNGANAQQMVLYFAADQNTNVTITIPGNGYTQNLYVPANTVATSNIIPKTGTQDARLTTEGLSSKGIHVTADKPVVAYAHIYNSNVSGATILYPTNTLGKEYYSINYTNISNSSNSNCWFYVVAADTGTTTVDIIPSSTTLGGWTPGNTYTVTLQQGQVYNVMGTFSNTGNPQQGADLTGSVIKSRNTGTGCKKIAVFSGSGRISITCNGTSSSSDNYMVQAVPKAAWGKKYLTVPTAPNMSYNPYRICVTDPTTVVTVNGAPIAVPLISGFYYQLAATNQPQKIEADKPVMVAQYITSQGACSNGTPGDPEVIYLSPVEQNINKVLWNATPNFNITQHYINVVIPNSGTSISSFLLDGVPVGAASWITHPGDANYSYCRIGVTGGQHQLFSDSGFNAIAYGYGNTESYGYNAGTNIKDLFQFVNIKNLYGNVNFPATCRNAPFNLAMVFPYQPIQIDWIFGAPLNAVGFNDTTIYNGGSPITADSSWVVSGRTLYRYRLPRQYSIPSIGTYPIRILATNPTPDNCGSVQEVTFDLQVFEAPTADFTFTTSGCFNQPVNFFDNSNPGGRPVISRYWDFADNTNTGLNNPTHTYAAPGTYNVKYTYITDVGCLADTVSHPVTLDPIPTAQFSANPPYCVNQPITFTDQSTTAGSGSPLAVWTWDFGDATPIVVRTSSTNEVHSYTNPGNYVAKLTVQTTSGCNSTVFQFPITILPNAIVTRTSAVGTDNQTVCINNPITNIVYSVTGSVNAATVTGLPAGVTGSYVSGVFTISGTPTSVGTFNYTVTGTGSCAPGTATGTITVSDDARISLSSAPGTNNQTICINTPITSITYAITGSGTGGAVVGLPAGLTGSYSGGVFTISGSPTVAGVFNYTVNTTGPCLTPSATGTITVTANGVLTLTSGAGSNNQTVCINNPISNITYSVTGSSTSGSVSGLPAGVTGNYAGGVVTISGTPTASGVFNYTVTTTGPCVNPTATGTLTVTANGSITLSSAAGTDNQTICINTAITDITYNVGGSGNGGNVTGLPAGVTGTFAGGVVTITGTPSVAGVFNYIVNTTGPCVNPTATGTITVRANTTITLTSAPGTNNQTLCINVPIVNITYAVGGTGTNGTVSGLPTGVTGNYAGGVVTISGTPTVSGVFNYTVNTTGPCVNPTATGTLTVTANGSITLSSAAGTDNQTICINTAITDITYNVGGSGNGGNVTGLPAGVSGTYAGGVVTISGTPSVAGVFNYTVNTTGPCINPTASGTITVRANTTLTLTSAPGTNNQTLCINVPIVNITYAVGGTGTNGTVTGLPAGVAGTYAAGVVTISGTPTVAGVFNYTVNTAGPCVNPTANGTITVNEDASITLTSAPPTAAQELCKNSPLTNIEYTVGGTATNATVIGLPAGVTGSFSAGVFTISGTPSIAGVFNYTVTATGICLPASKSGTITVNDLPTSNFTTNTPVCETRTISFTDVSTPNTGSIATWAWNFGDPPSGAANVSGLQNPTHTFATAGTYNVTLIVTTNKGCISTQPARQVVVNLRPLAGFIDPEVCLNDQNAIFVDTSKVSLPDVISGWNWNFGDPVTGPLNTSNLQNPGHTFSGTGSFNVQLIAITNKGCRDTLNQNIFVNGSFPQANFVVQNASSLCVNDTVRISEASTVSPGTITKVEIYWDNVGQPGVFVTDNNPSFGKIYKNLYPPFQSPLTKTYTIRYRAYSGGICVNDKFRTITLNAAPKVQFTAIPNICLDAVPYQITQASEIGGVPGTGVFSGPGVSPTGLFNPAIAGAGTHTIRYKYASTAAGCLDSAFQTIHVYAPAIADFSVSSPVCEKQTAVFTQNSSATEGTIGQWVWNFGDATPVANLASGAPINHTFNAYGTFNVTLNVVTSNGCRSVAKVIPVSVKPLARPNFSFPAVSCLPNTVINFSNLSSIPDGTESSFSYLWNFGDPGSGPVNNSSLQSPSHTYSAMGPYTINLQVTTGAGCIHDTSIVLNSIHPQPIADFTTDKVDVCVGGAVTFTSNSNPLDGTISTYNWTMDDGNIRTAASFSYTYGAANQYNISHYIINSFNCKSNVVTKQVSINPYPVVNAGPDKLMLEGGQTQLTPQMNPTMPVTYSWTPATYLDNPTIKEPIARPPDDKTYLLTVTTNKGCTKSDGVFIKVLKKPDIPNIFSPNGDGQHDVWVIKYLESYPGCTVDVVNRYGQLVFHSVGYGTPWDGKVNGKDVPLGTYYYVVDPKNGRAKITGFVDIIR